MGVFEQLLEINQQLSKQMLDMQREIADLKSKIITSIEQKNNADDEIVLRFRGNDKLNASMTAKALGIKQVELYRDIENGRIYSIGEAKRIFLAKEVIRYKNAKQNNVIVNSIIPQKKFKKIRVKKKISEVINEVDLQELYAEQQAV